MACTLMPSLPMRAAGLAPGERLLPLDFLLLPGGCACSEQEVTTAHYDGVSKHSRPYAEDKALL